MTILNIPSSTVALVLLALATRAPSSDAFRTGKTPQGEPNVATTTTTTATPIAPPVPVTPGVPPMPFKWPIVGTLPDFIVRGGVDSMASVHETMYKDYGAVYGMSLMGEDEIVFSDPRVLDQVLRKEGQYPLGGAELISTFPDYYRENDMSLALSSTQNGPQWKEWRQTVNADMYVLWDTYLPSIAETCAKISAVAGFEVNSNDLHMADFLSRCSFDMFGTVLYGESLETVDSSKADPKDLEFVKATKRAFDITGNLISNPLEKIFEGELYKEFVTNMDTTVALAGEHGTKRIQMAIDNKSQYEEESANALDAQVESSDSEPNSSSSSSGCPMKALKLGLQRNRFIPSDYTTNPSFVERLVNREKLNSEEISEVQGPLLMAGVDTTAYVMGWFYLNMASNPEIQAKLANELHETLQGADVTTAAQMESLTYLQQCFRESHRLTPPAPLQIKRIKTDIDVVAFDKQYSIPSGQRISLNLRGFPMDPQYVENPGEYIPERFDDSAIAARIGTPSEIALDHPYFQDPFGRGKRRCLGANVAMAEMICLAARLLQDWEISLVDPSEAVQSPTKTWSAKQKLMLIADPYPAMKFTPRQKQPAQGEEQ